MLPEAYALLREHEAPALNDWVRGASDRTAIFVASGGGLAAARLGADLHERTTGQIAKALTPLEFAFTESTTETATLLLSTNAKHPDALLVARVVVSRAQYPFALLTLRPVADLPTALKRYTPTISVLPAMPGREGFLATTSVLSMATALTRAYIGSASLPADLSMLQKPLNHAVREDVIVLSAPGYMPAALDFETRASELGLCGVQVTDYRNFGHGRHVGLQRRLGTTTVVALLGSNLRQLAEATLAELPQETSIVRIESQESWPVSAIETMVGSMQIIGSTAEAQQIEPSRPKVPTFGRRLYHLSSGHFVEPTSIGPVERKVLASGGRPSDRRLVASYAQHFDEWIEKLKRVSIRGVVLDYDGTCCETSRRFDPTPEPIRAELVRLLEEGCVMGFASGRGQSLHRDLRRAIPRRHWPAIELGMYNGTLVLRLDDELPDQTGCIGDLAAAADRLDHSPLAGRVVVERRRTQVTVQASDTLPLVGRGLVSAVTEIVLRPPHLDLRVVASAHSADIVPMYSSKGTVVETVGARAKGPVLAIGDQGQLGGNDFDLLASTAFSLSVDHCSADPTRCWNVDSWGAKGPELLVRYLRPLRAQRDGFRFSSRVLSTWKGPGSARSKRGSLRRDVS